MQRLIIAFILLALLTPVQAARAAPGSFLSDECGIAAFFPFNGPTILASNLLRNHFRTIPVTTANYLIGSVAVAGFESEADQDVTVMIHNDGWVIAYYPKGRATPQALAWAEDPNAPTRLAVTLATIAEAIEASDPVIQYTHCQYQDATHWLRMGRHGSGTAEKPFDFRLPMSGNTFYERSWMAAAGSTWNATYVILDGREVGQSGKQWSGIIPASAMVLGAKHVAVIYGKFNFFGWEWGEIDLVYSGDAPIMVNTADVVMDIPLVPLPKGLQNAAQDVPRFFDTYMPLVVRR